MAGQMIAALFLNYYGAIGLNKVPANPERIVGVVLVVLSVSSIAYTKR
jgi:bacterial/archaeal transporter family-2 protein